MKTGKDQVIKIFKSHTEESELHSEANGGSRKGHKESYTQVWFSELIGGRQAGSIQNRLKIILQWSGDWLQSEAAW